MECWRGQSEEVDVVENFVCSKCEWNASGARVMGLKWLNSIQVC